MKFLSQMDVERIQLETGFLNAIAAVGTALQPRSALDPVRPKPNITAELAAAARKAVARVEVILDPQPAEDKEPETTIGEDEPRSKFEA